VKGYDLWLHRCYLSDGRQKPDLINHFTCITQAVQPPAAIQVGVIDSTYYSKNGQGALKAGIEMNLFVLIGSDGLKARSGRLKRIITEMRPFNFI
jgi:hypothetical protein